jgi:hypothetical protein
VFEHTQLIKADLSRANLQGARIESAYCWDATLVGANLRRVRLTGTSLDEADLTGADLAGAHLRGIDLVEADLTGANLVDVRYDVETLWPASVNPAARGAVAIVDRRKRPRWPTPDEVEAQDRVRVLLRQSFADVPVYKETAALSRDELRHLMPLLMQYPDEYLWGVLPRVLDCLLDPPRSDAWWAIGYLNVPAVRSEEQYANSGLYRGEEKARKDRWTDAELGRWKVAQCQYFTCEQSRTVLEWLLIARTWKEAAIELDDIDPAIEYWATRAGVDPVTVRRKPRSRRRSP